MTVLPLGFLGDFVSGGRSNLIGVIPARFRLWKNETKTRLSFHDLERSFEDLRRLERVFRCRGVCETMEDYKEGYLMVWTNYMSTCRSIVGSTLRVLVTSYQLPWQRTRSTKVSSNLQFL